MQLSKLSSYVLWEWVKIFTLSLMAILGTILMGLLYDDGSHLVRAGAGFSEIADLYITFIPSLLPIALPVAYLLSLLFVLTQWNRHYEWVAMQACGLSRLQITKPLWISGILLSTILYVANAYWTPHSTEAFTRKEQAIYKKSKASYNRKNQTEVSKVLLKSTSTGRIWYIQRLDTESHTAYGIHIYQQNSEGKEVERVVATSGIYDPQKGYWNLLNGRILNLNPITGDFEELHSFEQQAFPKFQEDPELMALLSKKPRHLSALQLQYILTELEELKDTAQIVPFQLVYQKLWMQPLSCLIVFIIAIPLATGRLRTNVFVGITQTLGIFFAYYMLVNFFDVLGYRQILPVALSVVLPPCIVALWGIYLWNRKAA